MAAAAWRRRVGTALVTAQLTLIALLAASGLPALVQGLVPAGAWGLAAASALLGAWALWANRPGNFNVRPAPRPGARLVRHGPYRWIRHPMYSAVLLCGAACAWAAGVPSAWLCAAALLAVLAAKALLEERWMRQEHAGYAAYSAGTWRFVPYLW